ncbi:MAG TPA: helix-turn-helix domain-containing protein, partial [Bacillota bacterium]
ALIRLVAHASLSHAAITLDLARETLKDLLPAAQPVTIGIPEIQEVVAGHYGVSVRDLKLRSRARAVAFPRQVAMYLCRDLTHASLPKIGEDFGGRDHTTVLHACEKIRAQAERDAGLRDTLQHLITRLRQRG